MSEAKKIATRDIDADLAAATKTGVFKKVFPERHILCDAWRDIGRRGRRVSSVL